MAPSRFQSLLSGLQEEHEREVAELRDQVSKLTAQLELYKSCKGVPPFPDAKDADLSSTSLFSPDAKAPPSNVRDSCGPPPPRHGAALSSRAEPRSDTAVGRGCTSRTSPPVGNAAEVAEPRSNGISRTARAIRPEARARSRSSSTESDSRPMPNVSAASALWNPVLPETGGSPPKTAKSASVGPPSRRSSCGSAQSGSQATRTSGSASPPKGRSVSSSEGAHVARADPDVDTEPSASASQLRNKFERQRETSVPANVDTDPTPTASELRNKFEQSVKPPEPTMKKTWAPLKKDVPVPSGNGVTRVQVGYKQSTSFTQPPPPKKAISDLP